MKKKRIVSVLMAMTVACGSAELACATEEPVVAPVKKSFVKTGCVPQSLSAPPEIIGESGIVVDMATGYTLYEKNVQAQHYPASITKVMTATLALENLNMTDVVTFSHDAVFTIEPGSSSAYVNEGEQLTVEQCLYGLMLISGNDLANGLGEQVAGTMDAFALKMTQKAADLGCIGTQFKNAHGLHDPEHYTTAYDMAIMAINAYQNETFRKLCSTVRYDVPPTNMCEETRYWLNNNRMIREGEEYYYPECIGGKTGFTNEAGGTLVTFADVNGRKLACVIMKSTNSADAYEDSIKLYDYVKGNIQPADYEALDKKAEEDAKLAEALANAGAEKQTTKKYEPSTTNDAEENTEKESSGFFKGFLKLVFFICLVLGAWYVYVLYRRYQAKKRKIERMRRRRMQQQRSRKATPQRQRPNSGQVGDTIKPRNPNKDTNRYRNR